jgi:hypothetical protein
MQPQKTHLIYEFGDFELDALRRVLVSRGDGRQVEVTGRVLEALVYLVERPAQLVDKKGLIGYRFVAEVTCVRRRRRATQHRLAGRKKSWWVLRCRLPC